MAKHMSEGRLAFIRNMDAELMKASCGLSLAEQRQHELVVEVDRLRTELVATKRAWVLREAYYWRREREKGGSND